MTQENKEILLKDLCARLPYGVKIFRSYVSVFGNTVIEDNAELDVDDIDSLTTSDEQWAEYKQWAVKPYLRPMSSMTGEKKELMKGSVICFNELEGNSTLFDEIGLDWLNANHFDYRGLIEKGLAIEAPEGMYERL